MELLIYFLTLFAESLFASSLDRIVFDDTTTIESAIESCYKASIKELKNKKTDKNFLKFLFNNENIIESIFSYLFNEKATLDDLISKENTLSKKDISSFFKLLKSNLKNDPVLSNLYALRLSTDRIVDEINKVKKMSDLNRIDSLQLLTHIPSCSNKIIPRKKYFEKIDVFLSSNNIAYLQGDGGIGKSEIAKNYINLPDIKSKYSNICWLTYEENIINTLANQLKVIGIYNNKKSDRKNIFREYILLLNYKIDKGERILIVLDNFDVEYDQELTELLNTGIDLIITSRYLSEIYTPIKICPMQKKQLLKLFKNNCPTQKYYSKENEKIIYDIIHILQCHTLAVELIAKTIYNGNLNIVSVKENLTKGIDKITFSEQIKMIKDGKYINGKMYELILSIFSISMLNETEKNILINMSIFPLSGVEKEHIVKILSLPNMDQINSLIIKGWLKYDEQLDIVYVHTIIRDISFCELKVNPLCIDNTLTYLKSCLEHTDESFFKIQEYINIANSVVERISANEHNILMLNIYVSRALIYLGKYILARDLLKRTILCSNDILCTEEKLEIQYRGYLNIGFSYSKEYNIEKAIKNYFNAKEFLDKLSEIKTVNYGQLYNDIGMAYYRNQKNDDAMWWFKKAIKSIPHPLDSRNSKLVLAEIKNNFGALYYQIALDEKDENLQKKFFLTARYNYIDSLRYRKEILGKNNMLTLITYNNIGTLHFSQGRYDLALICFNDVYNCRKKLFRNKNHHEIAEVLYNIGVVLHKVDKKNEALAKFEEAINILSFDLLNQKELVITIVERVLDLFKEDKIIQNKYNKLLNQLKFD